LTRTNLYAVGGKSQPYNVDVILSQCIPDSSWQIDHPGLVQLIRPLIMICSLRKTSHFALRCTDRTRFAGVQAAQQSSIAPTACSRLCWALLLPDLRAAIHRLYRLLAVVQYTKAYTLAMVTEQLHNAIQLHCAKELHKLTNMN